MLKKITAVLLVLCFSLSMIPITASAGGSGQYDMWGFDGSDESFWTFIDGDGDGNSFEVRSYAVNAYALISDSYDSDNDIPLAPDNYAISPAVELTTVEDELFFKWVVFGTLLSYSDEHYSVYVYTDTETLTADNIESLLPEAAFSETVPEYNGIQFARYIDISAYMGQTVRFVFRHHDSIDRYALAIDNISISNTSLTSHVHVWDTFYTWNDTHHWKNCTVNNCPNLQHSEDGDYGEHSYIYDYNQNRHWNVCDTCAYEDNRSSEAHSFEVSVYYDYINYHCTVCGADYNVATENLIELPITIDGSAIAGATTPTVVPTVEGTEKYNVPFQAWVDSLYYPVTEFVDGEPYIYIIMFEPKAYYSFPLDVHTIEAVIVDGVEWDSVSVYLADSGHLHFEGVITYDSETGIPEESSGDSSEESSEDSSSEESSGDSSEESSEDSSSEDNSSEESSDDDSSDDVADILYGDVNGDGQVNSLDAAQVLKHDALLIVLDDEALVRADVNCDGVVNSLDAAQILKYDAFIIDSFPVETIG